MYKRQTLSRTALNRLAAAPVRTAPGLWTRWSPPARSFSRRNPQRDVYKRQEHSDPEVMADYDDLFETEPDAEQRRLGAFALKQFKAYKLAAGKTAKSILISCSTRLAHFAIDEVLELSLIHI